MFCHNCGHRNPEGVNFCSSCGAALAPNAATTVAFIPEDPSGEMGDEELGIRVEELAQGTGVLVVKRGPDTGAKYVLDTSVTRVGRHPESDIFLDDITVSRRHAEFIRDDGRYRIRDVGSLNGTYVNRERIDETALSSGDEVQIGKFKLVFLAARVMSSTNEPSDRSYLSIGEVLELLVTEFPDVTISKIRFLESKGLIHTERTPSGYRKFYADDVNQLRWILRQQRENFLPLKVIKGRLQNGTPAAATPSLFDEEPQQEHRRPEDDATSELVEAVVGHVSERASHVKDPRSQTSSSPHTETLPETAAVEPATAVEQASPAPKDTPEVPDKVQQGRSSRPATAQRHTRRAGPAQGRRHDASDEAVSLSRSELAGASGAAPDLIAELEEYGLIKGCVVAGVLSFDDGALDVTKLAASFARFGIEPRHLRSIKHSSDREAALFTQVVAPLLHQRNPNARDRARHDLEELTDLGAAIANLFVQGALRDLMGPS